MVSLFSPGGLAAQEGSQAPRPHYNAHATRARQLFRRRCGLEHLDRLRLLVVAFEARLIERAGGHASDEFGEPALDAVADEFLAGFRGPKVVLDFAKKNSCLLIG